MPEENDNDSLSTSQNQTNVTPLTQSQSGEQNVQPPEHLKSKILITAGAILGIFIMSIGVFLFYFLTQDKETTNNPASISSEAPALVAENALEPPELYSEFEWNEITPTAPFDLPLLYIDSEPLDASISGREWNYKATEINEVNSLRSGFDDYYAQETTRLGWNNSLEYKGVNIQALSADGPTGAIIGYLKISRDKIILIMLSVNTEYKGGRTDENLFSCPCNTEFNVFISDPLFLEGLIKRVGEY
ncbi:MAG: hypothetical protein COU25_03855 [Candidatus Levybacteria bacterium CG10_big_fil_rev_8_21_14_0_10_35_13]|nr:MAG: hypothetical protein COU25_03855 [Candidatus Levybacteria bacterium CG10_big_fil_rev_8_21_14_0_10_35_13]